MRVPGWAKGGKVHLGVYGSGQLATVTQNLTDLGQRRPASQHPNRQGMAKLV